MDPNKIPPFNPEIFLERAEKFLADEIIVGFVSEKKWNIQLLLAEGFQFSLRQDSGYSNDELWDKLENTLRKLRFFFAPEEATSFVALEKTAILKPVLDSLFTPLVDEWQNFLNSEESAPIPTETQGQKQIGAFHGRPVRIYLRVYLYGYALHSDTEKRKIRESDMAYIGDHIQDHNFFTLIRILKGASKIIAKAAFLVEENRHDFA